MKNEDKYTSIELSKKLKEVGFKGESEKLWEVTQFEDENLIGSGLICSGSQLTYGDTLYSSLETHGLYPAFDIMNDICIKYPVEFFGEETICGVCKDRKGCERDWHYCASCQPVEGYEHHTCQILELMQQGDKKGAEDYIWENCLFNKTKGEDNGR